MAMPVDGTAVELRGWLTHFARRVAQVREASPGPPPVLSPLLEKSRVNTRIPSSSIRLSEFGDITVFSSRKQLIVIRPCANGATPNISNIAYRVRVAVRGSRYSAAICSSWNLSQSVQRSYKSTNLSKEASVSSSSGR